MQNRHIIPGCATIDIGTNLLSWQAFAKIPYTISLIMAADQRLGRSAGPYLVGQGQSLDLDLDLDLKPGSCCALPGATPAA